MADKHLISDIVPVYNCEYSLYLTLDSLLKQTYSNIEIILVDDGAKDSSGALCDKYAESDDRIISIHQINHGAAGARNIGIKAAQGEYISFIDAGDYVEQNLYESLLMYVADSIEYIDFSFLLRTGKTKDCLLGVELKRIKLLFETLLVRK